MEREFRGRCIAAGAHIKIERLPYILNTGRIIVGDHVTLSGSSDITFSNIVRPDPELCIGNHTFIGHGCNLSAAESIVIGDHCLIAARVRIQDFDGHPMDAELRRSKPTPPEGIKPIRIGNDVWIGYNSIILKGVTIGERAVVSAMSLVADDVPADALVGGNPARVVKFLNGRGPAQFADAIPSETFGTLERYDWDSHRPDQDGSETRIKNVLAAVARVPADEIDVADWVNRYGIDSLKLLIVRETLERELRLRFSDRVWFSFRSIRDIVDFVDRTASGPSREIHPAPVSINGAKQKAVCKPPSLGRRYTPSGMLYADIEIGLPLTGRNNLAEGPLLQQLGHLRWAHISQISGVPSCSITDGEGNRLYATFFFVEILFPNNRPMASYRPDDQIKLAGDLKRFGFSILDGTFYLVPLDAHEVNQTPCAGTSVWADAPQVRLANVFVRQQRGAEQLQRSRPASPDFERIAEVTQPPDSYLQVKAAERDGSFARPPASYVPMTSAPVTVKYNLDPDRDVNGVGLIYFAHYPVFLDIAERQVLRTAALPLSEELINQRSLIHRRSAYMSNASARDSLLIEVEPWIDNPAAPHRLWLNFRMHRASDGRLM
ncbi:MAG TPA: LnmK family bifunctional acyltransferase/decarboxylase, partial [Candidatus Acidoferrales bacterium]|nr:LnmK family bifunctional acyltransferase/decarboxylase [Candidatus Acidoferrales bacterium]